MERISLEAIICLIFVIQFIYIYIFKYLLKSTETFFEPKIYRHIFRIILLYRSLKAKTK